MLLPDVRQQRDGVRKLLVERLQPPRLAHAHIDARHLVADHRTHQGEQDRNTDQAVEDARYVSDDEADDGGAGAHHHEFGCGKLDVGTGEVLLHLLSEGALIQRLVEGSRNRRVGQRPPALPGFLNCGPSSQHRVEPFLDIGIRHQGRPQASEHQDDPAEHQTGEQRRDEHL
ncbi:MAG: hypothetical protein NTZ05_22800 [Chloroflexi bacterium]|nr:hypothetical protein [Chloroflexota bacterium]